MADLAYAPASERLAARPVLAIVMAVPAAAIAYDLTLLLIFLYYQFPAFAGISGSFVFRGLPGLVASFLKVVVGVVLILTAVAGWRSRRVGPTGILCLIYAIVVVVMGLVTFVFDWTQIGGRSGMGTYVIQRTITSLTPGIVPLVCSIMLRQLATAWGERA